MQKIKTYRLPVMTGLATELVIRAFESRVFFPLLAIVLVTAFGCSSDKDDKEDEKAGGSK